MPFPQLLAAIFSQQKCSKTVDKQTKQQLLEMPSKGWANNQLAAYFFSPSLHAVVTLGHQLLVEKAVEKMNLEEESRKKYNQNLHLHKVPTALLKWKMIINVLYRCLEFVIYLTLFFYDNKHVYRISKNGIILCFVTTGNRRSFLTRHCPKMAQFISWLKPIKHFDPIHSLAKASGRKTTKKERKPGYLVLRRLHNELTVHVNDLAGKNKVSNITHLLMTWWIKSTW